MRIVQFPKNVRPLFISKILRSFVLRRNIEDSKRRTVSDDINGNFESLTIKTCSRLVIAEGLNWDCLGIANERDNMSVCNPLNTCYAPEFSGILYDNSGN